jgi:phenylalanyl-tRNA synthetase beta subunit
MGILKDAFKIKADLQSAEIKEIIKTHGNVKVDEVTLAQIYQGMRGITGLVLEAIVYLSYKKNYQKQLEAQNLYQRGFFI